MVDGDSPPRDDHAPEEDCSLSDQLSESVDSATSPLDRVSLADSPILLLVYFHKAFRAEVADLRREVSHASERGHHARDFVVELLRRFEFLKLACKYHCAAEDEVVFLALDVHVKNVAYTYSLEHKSIDDLFDSIFLRLNAMLEENVVRNVSTKPFQELVLLIGTIQAFISKHMLKEEKQVFPLLVEHISIKEQASLVWQFMCSVPIVLLEDMFPWMLSFLSSQEQAEVKNCIREIVPEEKSLQEVVLSWLGTNSQLSTSIVSHTDSIGGVSDMKILLKSCSCWRYIRQSWNSTTHNLDDDNSGKYPLDALQLWHSAIKKDLVAVLGGLYQAKSSSNFSNLENIVIQLKFLADVITFYSNALEKLFSPVSNQLVHGHMSPPAKWFPSGSHIEGLHMILYHTAQNDKNLSKFVTKLCLELESFIGEITKQFSFHEKEVFPIIGKSCSCETQKQILYVSVHVMPLGLLKSVITWFSSHLPEEDRKSFLTQIKHHDDKSSPINGPFASLLREWFRSGCSGKISAEKFEENLHQMFKTRRSFVPDQTKDSDPIVSSKMGKNCFPHSSSSSYSSVINLHIYFPETIKTYHPFSEIIAGGVGQVSCSGSAIHDPKPMDFIFYFHKALKADLEYLVFGSLRLAENAGFITEFRRRFNLIEFLYQIHSDAEDEVAFPALEAMGKVANISHSYTMDHQLEIEHFKKVSLILDNLAGLSSSDDPDDDRRMKEHYRLCIKLYDTCESMHRLLTDHIHREEVELWPLFRECFSAKEQERMVGSILGRTNAEVLRDMIPWLMGSLTQEEQHTMMSLWRHVTRNTMFDEWLREWWEGDNDMSHVVVPEKDDETSSDDHNEAFDFDPLEVVFEYLSENGEKVEDCRYVVDDTNSAMDSEFELTSSYESSVEYRQSNTKDEKKRVADVQTVECRIKPGTFFEAAQRSKHYDLLMKMSQEDLEAAIRRVSRDSALDSKKKSFIIQNLLVSRWIVRHHSNNSTLSKDDDQEFPGQNPSYRDPLKLSFGCKHYKRNCKTVAPCCNQLYTCLKCHDEMADHIIDRKTVTEMMCMQCLKIQPIGPVCTTPSCNKLSMAKYFCRICKIFDDERMIYHCPYCNLCRVGKGLGIDYYHCMNCNACMSRMLVVHVCREKCFMDNCPICHEDLFTSSLAVKALQCGHLMHSECFEAYTCTNYTCPICGKSLGDMQVYFKMLDALLAEEKIPEEYAGQTKAILCIDCEKRGEAKFHWRYHKCPHCGSYNTRVL